MFTFHYVDTFGRARCLIIGASAFAALSEHITLDTECDGSVCFVASTDDAATTGEFTGV